MCRLFSKIYKRIFYRARSVALYKYDTSMVIDQAFRIITWYPPAGRNPLCVVYGSAEQIFIAHPSEPLSEPTLIKISNMGSFSKMFIGGGNCNTRRIQDIFHKSITNCLLMFTSEMYNILVYLKHILLSYTVVYTIGLNTSFITYMISSSVSCKHSSDREYDG
jgi:hypothetical protein